MFNNSIQFWHYLHEFSIRSHRLKGLSLSTLLLLQMIFARPKPCILLTNWLQIRRFPQHPPQIWNLWELLTELKKIVYLYSLVCCKGYNSETAKMQEMHRSREMVVEGENLPSSLWAWYYSNTFLCFSAKKLSKLCLLGIFMEISLVIGDELNLQSLSSLKIWRAELKFQIQPKTGLSGDQLPSWS